LKVELGERSYEICIGEHSIPQLGYMLDFVPQTSRMILITDENVNRLAGDKVIVILRQAGFQVESAVIKGGEECKNMATLTSLLEQMVAFGLDRKSTVIALGGGIVGDIAGFAAATYMRGISYVQVPTTLLAQVDSSVGGKTGVNLPQGKNLVGAFFQPGLVFVDVDFIQTLPEREFLTGLAEVIKYGIIRDHEFFKYLEDNMEKIKARDSKCLIHIVNRCCAIKADIVAQDETENGLRALLNLGHTFGHAFEALTNYQLYTHGEAVAIGMVCAARLARHLGLLPRRDLDRINNLLRGYGLPVSFGHLGCTAIISQMHKDKKTIGGNMQIVMPTAIGNSQIFKNIKEDDIRMVLRDSEKVS
jgi:3-dehydroquinate synthase